MTRSGIRPKRMPINSACLIMRGGESWVSELRDISATGVLVSRPEGWQAEIGDVFVLDMIVGEQLTINVEAQVARQEGDELGFAYSRIPEDKEIPLWNLLGGYADSLEPFAR